MSYTNKSKTTRARKNYTATPVWEVRVGNGKNAESIKVIGCYQHVVQSMLITEWRRVHEGSPCLGRCTLPQSFAKACENVTLKRVGTV